VADLVVGTRHSAAHHFFGVLGAGEQAALQFLERWRQDEDRNQVFERVLRQLLGTLPVDVEQNVLAGLQGIKHRATRRAVGIAEYGRMFQELTGIDHGVELRLIDEHVVLAVDLARPHGAGRRRDRHGEIVMVLEKRARDRRLAGARRRRQHQHQAAPEYLGCGHVRASLDIRQFNIRRF
jgi:hypothetical protein